MNKGEQVRLRRAIRAGELDQTWITLPDRMVFAEKVTIAPHGIVIHTRYGLIDTQVDQIVKAVH